MVDAGVLVFEDTEAGSRAMKRRVAGLTLLQRGLRTMARAGVRSIAVVHPAGGCTKVDALTRKLDLDIQFVSYGSEAIRFEPAHGHLLVFGEYVHHHSILHELMEAGLGPNEVIVHAGRPHQAGGSLIGVEELPSGIGLGDTADGSALASTGAFLCAPGILSPSSFSSSDHDLLAVVVQELDGRRSALHRSAADLWCRAFDRASSRSAKNMLFSQVTKPTSGFVSRNINARISIPASKLLIETGLSPHLVTVLFVLPTGLAAAYFVTMADEYRMLLLAGVLWQFAAIFDRCDGEIARVRLCESKFGAWFDTITDNIAYLGAYAGLMIGMQRLYPGSFLYVGLGVSAIVALLLYLALAYRYALKTGSGSLQHYLRDSIHNVPDDDKIFVYKIMERYGFVAKRDFFSFLFFLVAAANVIQVIYWFAIVGLHLLVAAVLISQKKVHETYRRTQLASDEDAIPALETVPVASGRTEKAG